MTVEFRPRGPFAPATTDINNTAASQSTRPVTIPHLPELYQPYDHVLPALFPDATPSKPKIEPPSNAFMTALNSQANQTVTTNNADAYKSTLSPTLDAFSSLSQSTDAKDIADLLSASWAADPNLTLLIIWNLRSIHDGKSAREPFYRTFGWLYAHHPKTAVANLTYLVEPCVKRVIKRKPVTVEGVEDLEVITKEEAEGKEGGGDEVTMRMPHGYWKDLLNILVLAAMDELAPTSLLKPLHIKQEKQEGKKARSSRYKRRKMDPETAAAEPSGEERKQAALAKDRQTSEEAKKNCQTKYTSQHALLVSKLDKDKSFRALYVTVARLFADGLARDLHILRQIADESTTPERRIELSFSLSLAGKWAPSVGGSHDRITNIATPIAELLCTQGLLPLGQLPQPLTAEVAHRLRATYTRWATSPLRRFLEIPEVAMSANRWGKLKYTRVSSKCMQLNKKKFLAHDEERFIQYLLDVARGKKKISGATLLPHELLEEALHIPEDESKHDNVDKINRQVVDAQWRSLVERVKESGTLRNALAVCDVSGSMGHLHAGGRTTRTMPIFPALALSILLAQVASPPWKDTFITFSQSPELVTIQPEAWGLAGTARRMNTASWDMNTDFNAVFMNLILPAAVQNQLKPEDMIKRLFVFTDMQFDDSQEGNAFKTEHQKVKEAFEKKGYQLPEIVYWNLAGQVAKQVTKEDEGVALVSGFSPGMLKVFLEDRLEEELAEEGAEGAEGAEEEEEEEGEKEGQKKEKKRLDPVETMVKALRKESFEGLKVYD